MFYKCQVCEKAFFRNDSTTICSDCMSKHLELCGIILDKYIFDNKEKIDNFYCRLGYSLLCLLVKERGYNECLEFLSELLEDAVFVEGYENNKNYNTIYIDDLIKKCEENGINHEILIPFLLGSLFHLYGIEEGKLKEHSLINHYVELLRSI